MNPEKDKLEEKRYSRYYEHDGMLRAYANRSMVMAMVFGVLAIGSFAFAVYVRLMPPTVVRVDELGNATVVGGSPAAGGHTASRFLLPPRNPRRQTSKQKQSFDASSRTI